MASPEIAIVLTRSLELLGGPLFIPRLYDRQRSKLFFFFSYDNEPNTVPQGLNELRMPTALERAGDYSQSYFPGTTQQIPGV